VRDVCTTVKMPSIYQAFQPITEAPNPLISEASRFFSSIPRGIKFWWGINIRYSSSCSSVTDLTVSITRRRKPLYHNQSTLGGRCAWALDCDRLLQGIHEQGAFPKHYWWSNRSCIREFTLQLKIGSSSTTKQTL
jgi:hypothetical protein